MAGKMGGRGRGKPAMSFSMEQLGFSKGEALPTPVLQPSPSYPPLDHKPLPIELTTEMSYLVELKRDFAEYMRESPNNVRAIVLNEDIERFCEDYEESIAECNRLEYDWSRMPVELKSLQKRKLQQQGKKRKHMDVDKKLMQLEKREKRQQTRLDKGEEEKDKEKEEEDAEERDTAVKEEEEADEEMDEGTDYANEYFETGESYLSEDDNDDGPTY